MLLDIIGLIFITSQSGKPQNGTERIYPGELSLLNLRTVIYF